MIDKSTNVDISTDAPLAANPCYVQPFSEVFNEDCIQVMKRYPDKFFDLAVVDPPYGIGANKMQLGNALKKVYRGKNDWDNSVPTAEYWEQLFRVSKNQIVWGGNYYQLPPSKCWLVWDKNNGESDFADGEMAWTSFDKPMRIKKIHWCGSASKWEDTNGKIHPTQKPVKLYDWIFSEFSKEGDLVLDTHLGSASSRISADKAKLRFVGCEIDTKYFNDGEARFKEFVSQLRLF